MIVYRLQCSKGHSFDEWFDSGSDCDTKMAAGGIACPRCGDAGVSKALMAPNVKTGASSAPELPPACGGGACGAGMCPMMGGE